MKIGKVLIENQKKSIEEVEVKDLRNPIHPEHKDDFDKDIQGHVNRAIHQNGDREYDTEIYDLIKNSRDKVIKVRFFEHLYHLLGQAKGIVKYRMMHGKSSFSRYQNHQYEKLDLLKKRELVKIDKKIFWAKNGTPRLELIHLINKLCEGIEAPTVLEGGCGSGLNIYMLNCLNPSLDVSGFEYTNARLASGIVNLKNSDLKNKLFLADLCALNLPDNSIDIVYTNHVLEQLGQERAETALKEIWRVCKRGMVICEPSIHGANIYERWRMRTLGYCEDLHTTAKELPNAQIEIYKEDNIRYYPNTSHHLVVRKQM